MSIIFFISMLISLALLLYSEYYKIYIFMIITKTISSILFVLTGFFAVSHHGITKFTKYSFYILLGLLFSLFGDIFLVIDKNEGIFFILGVISFGLAHISYSLGFFEYGKIELLNIISFLILFISLFCIMTFPNCFYYNGLFPLVLLYCTIISFMVSKSFSLWKFRKKNKKAVYMTLTGVLMFLISDFVLLFVFFLTKPPVYLGMLNSIIYYIGQGILALSLEEEIIKD